MNSAQAQFCRLMHMHNIIHLPILYSYDIRDFNGDFPDFTKDISDFNMDIQILRKISVFTRDFR